MVSDEIYDNLKAERNQYREAFEKSQKASETNYQQVLELGVLATDREAEIVRLQSSLLDLAEKSMAEIERLKGLIEKEFKAYRDSDTMEEKWQLFKIENNL